MQFLQPTPFQSYGSSLSGKASAAGPDPAVRIGERRFDVPCRTPKTYSRARGKPTNLEVLGGASLVSLNQRPLSSAFVHQALLLRTYAFRQTSRHSVFPDENNSHLSVPCSQGTSYTPETRPVSGALQMVLPP